MSETSIKAFAQQHSVRRQPISQPQFEEEVEYQAVSYGIVGRRPEIMLEFHRADGFRKAIAYIDIKEIDTSDPAKGFLIITPARKISVVGVNLERCYRYLKQNRIAELREADRPTAMAAPADEAIITELRLFK